MDCQSGCPLKGANFAYVPGANLDSGCPAQGSASMWALMEEPTQRTILVSTKNAVIAVWPTECNLQKVHARARKDLNELSSGTLPFPGCPRPGSTLCQRHPHALDGRRSGSELRPSGYSDGNG